MNSNGPLKRNAILFQSQLYMCSLKTDKQYDVKLESSSHHYINVTQTLFIRFEGVNHPLTRLIWINDSNVHKNERLFFFKSAVYVQFKTDKQISSSMQNGNHQITIPSMVLRCCL